MIHLIYISSATSWPTESDLIELLDQARSRNITKDITGMLIYDNATFLQVLEGEREDVNEIFNSICNDSRTTGIVKLFEEEIEFRLFPDWSMGFKALKSCSPGDLVGYADIFNGKLDKEGVTQNKNTAFKLLLNFAKNNS